MGKHINIHVGGLWRCKGTGGAGACTIARETRIQCKLCRWNACLKAGMRPELVHNSDAAVANIRAQGVLSRSTLAKISPGLCAAARPRPDQGDFKVPMKEEENGEGVSGAPAVVATARAPPVAPTPEKEVRTNSPGPGQALQDLQSVPLMREEMERALEDDKDAERPRDEGTGARREVESPPGVRPNARRPGHVPATADALGGHGSTPPPFAMPPSPVHYRKNQSSVRKRMLAHLDHVHRTWVLATKTVRSSREYVHALLALHSGYPDLMSSALFEDHLRALGGLFRYFAHLQPEFSDLSPAEQQRLLAQNTPLFLQYILSGYLKSESGCEQVRWMLVGRNPAANSDLRKINLNAFGELANVAESEPIGRYEDSVMKISHLNIELLPMTALAYLYYGCSEEHLTDISTLFEWTEYTMGRGTTRKALEKLISDSDAASSDFEVLTRERQGTGTDYRNSRVERIFTPPTECERLVVAGHLRHLNELCFSVAVENAVITQYVEKARFPQRVSDDGADRDRRCLIAMRNSVAGVLLERIKRLSRGCFREGSAASAPAAARLQMNYMNGLALYGTSLQFSDNLQAQVSVKCKHSISPKID